MFFVLDMVLLLDEERQITFNYFLNESSLIFKYQEPTIYFSDKIQIYQFFFSFLVEDLNLNGFSFGDMKMSRVLTINILDLFVGYESRFFEL